MQRLFTILSAIALAALSVTGASVGSTSTAQASTSPWHEIYSTTFPTASKVGTFANCSEGAPYVCTSLPKTLQSQWWAYPTGWPDTAESGQLGTYKVGGYYEPQSNVSIANGVMTINESDTNGVNSVATVVPKAGIDLTYGRYVETTRVTEAPTGYKSAHLLWPDNADTTAQQNSGAEIDFPEGDWNDAPANGGDAYVYDHPAGNPSNQLAADCNCKWSAWNTYTIDWWPGNLTVYVNDGNSILHATGANVPTMAMDWIIQNESSLDGQSAVSGSHAQMQIKYIEVDKYVG